jgi:hypothetical protein
MPLGLSTELGRESDPSRQIRESLQPTIGLMDLAKYIASTSRHHRMVKRYRFITTPE